MSETTMRHRESQLTAGSSSANCGGVAAESYSYYSSDNVLSVYDGSGQSLPSSGIGNRYLFQGRETSWATHEAWGGAGLYYFRARWYDPSTGRWLSNDPIGISGGLNQYAITHWWSTKPWDPVTGLSEYQFRMYSPELGRWLSRDPIEETGGINIFQFTGNSAQSIDALGLFWDWINYIPIAGTLRTRFQLYVFDNYPGTRVAHFKTPGVTPEDCCYDPIMARERCLAALEKEALDFAKEEGLSQLIKSGISLVGGWSVALIGKSWYGVFGIIDGFMGVDDMVEISNRSRSALARARLRCECP